MFLGLLSMRALEEAKRGSAADAVLKGAAILYSRTTCFASAKVVDDICDRVSVGSPTKLARTLRQCFVSTEELDPEFREFEDFDVGLKLQRWVEDNDTVDVNSAVELARDFRRKDSPLSHEAVSLYLSLHFDCPLHSHPLESPRLLKLLISDPGSVVSEQTPLRFSLPDLDLLSWADIAELRKSPYLEKYRLFVANFYLKADAETKIVEDINSALWETIGTQAPTASGSAIKRLLGQIPLPFGIPNPYSVYRDIKDGKTEAMLFRKYGWLWFIQEAKSLPSSPISI